MRDNNYWVWFPDIVTINVNLFGKYDQKIIMVQDDDIKRFTISLELSVFNQMAKDANAHKIPRGPYAGIIIKNHYSAEECNMNQNYSDVDQLNEEIERLKSEILELKKDKTWYQGEISQLHQNLPPALPTPKKSLFWFLNRKE